MRSLSGPWSPAQAVGHDGDRGDERDADHQRAGGDGRAARVAHRVAARQPAGRAADAAAGRPSSDAAARTARDGQAQLAAAGSASRSALTGAILVARRAGSRPATSVTSVPTEQCRRSTVRASNTVPPAGSVEVERAEERVQAGGQPEARADADDRRAEPEGERLDQHRAEHLTARGADRAQHRELTRALRDGDRQRVEDRERAHEDRDAAEHEQDDLDDRDELLQAVEREAVLRRPRSALGAVAEQRRRPRGGRPRPTPGGRRRGRRRSGPACRTASARSAGRRSRSSRCRAT